MRAGAHEAAEQALPRHTAGAISANQSDFAMRSKALTRIRLS